MAGPAAGAHPSAPPRRGGVERPREAASRTLSVVPRRSHARWAPCLLALALAGCGTAATISTSGLTPAQKLVATAISNFQSDAQANDTSKLCSQDLAPSVVRALSVGGHTCPSVMSDQLKVVDPTGFTLSLVANSIKISGTTATATVKDTQSGKTTHLDTLRLAKVGTTWKIAGLAG